MPLIYGSRFDLPKILPSEFQTQFLPSGNGLSFLRVLLTLLEVGTTLIPGVGPAAASAIAVASAAGNEAIDVAQGQVSAVNTVVNFASALIPGVSAGIKNVGAVAKATEHIDNVVSEYQGILDTANAGKNLANQQINTLIDYGNGMNAQLLSAGVSPEAAGDLINGAIGQQMGNAQNLLKQSAQDIHTATSSQEAFQSVVLKKNPFVDPFDSTGKQVLNDLLERQGLNIPTNEIQKAIDSVAGAGRRIVKASTAGIEAGEGSEEDLRKILQKSGFTEAELGRLMGLLEGVNGAAARNSITLDFLRDIGGLDRARNFATNYYEASRTAAKTKAAARLAAGEPVVKDAKFYDRFIKAVKKPASSEFNDMVVQPIQAIFDAGDLGRAPIEAAYKKLKKVLGKEFAKLGSWARKGIKMEEAFEKAGGIVIQDRAILGYKVISEVGNHSLLQISFRPGLSVYGMGTGAKHATWGGRKTKNYGGKKPVYVKASINQMERLREDGMNYYLKKWAYSRGGQAVGVGAFGLGGLTASAEMLLPFINTGLMRNILSLTSNIVQNMEKTIEGTGGFAKGWVDKFSKSFSRSWKNRAGRLFANGVIGNAAGKILGTRIGNLVGKESQRFFSSLTTTYNLRAMTANPTNSFGHAFVKSLLQKEMQGVTSHLKRASGNNAVTQSMGVQRKLGFVQRVPSSITGGKFGLSNIKIWV